MEQNVAAVLACYPDAVGLALHEVQACAGGFSGASVFRVMTAFGPLCLRGSSPGEIASPVAWRHRLLLAARNAGLDVVPALIPARSGKTVVEREGRCWELMQWMPGQADFHAHPTAGRLRQAASTLARIHLAWQRWAEEDGGECPAVLRRREAARRPIRFPALSHPVCERLRRERDFWLPRVTPLLAQTPRVLLQPVLRDVWHDHLLYEGDNLTGVVDYASVAIDSVAADLARMLGSLVEDDEEAWGGALEAYRSVRPLSLEEERLARVLDRTGVILALGNWLGWLSRGERDLAQGQVRARVERLLARVEGWKGSA